MAMHSHEDVGGRLRGRYSRAACSKRRAPVRKVTRQPSALVVLEKVIDLGPNAHGRPSLEAPHHALGAGSQVPNQAQAAGEAEGFRRHLLPVAELLKRSFGIDALECPKCHGRMQLIALLRERESIVG
jgi:hypothetical protein